MVLGCALFHDIVKPLQYDEVCVISSIERTLKASKGIESVISTPFDDLPTVKKVLSRVQHDGDEQKYQGVVLTKFEQGVFLQLHNDEIVEKVLTCLKKKSESSALQFTLSHSGSSCHSGVRKTGECWPC